MIIDLRNFNFSEFLDTLEALSKQSAERVKSESEQKTTPHFTTPKVEPRVERTAEYSSSRPVAGTQNSNNLNALIKALQTELTELRKLLESKQYRDASIEKWIKSLSDEIAKIKERLDVLEAASDVDCEMLADMDERISDLEDSYDYPCDDECICGCNSTEAEFAPDTISVENIKNYLEGKRTFHTDNIRHIERAIMSKVFNNGKEDLANDALALEHGKVDMIDEILKNLGSYLSKINKDSDDQ